MKVIRAAVMWTARVITGLVGCLTAPLFAADLDMSGFYRYEMGNEVAGQLILYPNYRFRYDASYGASDAGTVGTWSADAKFVRLVSDMHRPAFVEIMQRERPGGGRETNAKEPVHFGVEVCTHRRNCWLNAVIDYKFSDGSVKTRATGDRGLSELMESEVANGRYVSEVGISYPDFAIAKTWIKLESPRIRFVEVSLDPGVLSLSFLAVAMDIKSHSKKVIQMSKQMDESGLQKMLLGRFARQGPAPRYERPEPRESTVSVIAVSHLEQGGFIQNMYAGKFTEAAIDAKKKGDKATAGCCYDLPKKWKKGLTIDVRWTEGPQGLRYKAVIPVEKYSYPETVYLHLYPGAKLRAVSTYQSVEQPYHPIQPGDINAVKMATTGVLISKKYSDAQWKNPYVDDLED